LSRLRKFLATLHPKVVVSSLVSAAVAAFAPMLPGLLAHGRVSVTGGQLGLAVLVGGLTFAGGYLKAGPGGSPVAQELIKAALDAVTTLHPAPVALTASSALSTSRIVTDTTGTATVLPPPTVVLPEETP
jgi:hypothetical protein